MDKEIEDAINELLRQAVEAPNYKEAMKIIEEGNTRYYIEQFESLERYFQTIFVQEKFRDKVEYTMDKFTTPPIDAEILKHKAVVLCGKTDYGKTAYAMAHFKHPAVISSKLDFIKINEQTDGIILDNMDFSKWSISKVKNIINFSVDSYHDCKFSAVLLKKNIPRIICIPSENNFWPKELNELNENREFNEVVSISRRTHIVHISKPLFNRKRKQEDHLLTNRDSKVISSLKIPRL